MRRVTRCLPITLPLWFTLLCLTAAHAQAPAVWADGEHLDDALTYAKEHDVPLVILNIRKGQKVDEERAARAWQADRRLGRMAKVLVWKERAPEEFKSVERQASLSGTKWPRLFVLDPEGNVVGFASFDTREHYDRVLASATAVLDWRAKVPVRLDAADAAAKAGRFKEAMTTLEAVTKEDEQASAAVRAVRAHRWDDSGNLELEEVSLGPIFFPGVATERRLKYETLAAERVDEARAKRDAGELKEALQLVQPMLLSPSDLSADAGAKELAEQLRQMMRDEQARLAAQRATADDDAEDDGEADADEGAEGGDEGE